MILIRNLQKMPHLIYLIIGYIIAKNLEIYWLCRDVISPPREDVVLFVSHPDDDVLFFHQLLKNHKPYVICLTTAELPNRIFPFFRAMRHYKLRYRCFNMKSRDVDKEETIRKHIRQVLRTGHFKVCATHNASGEYGHIMHKCVHRCVKDEWRGMVLTPVDINSISHYPLSEKEFIEKNDILKKYYRREYPTLKHFEIWIAHEALTENG